jgi:hypothetical protein
MGHKKNSYQITQWYPKPAVYDLNGWHPMPYLDMGEFYSEFGNFDVKISLSDNYVVAATGNLQNPNEIKRLKTMAQLDCSMPNTDSTQIKTLHYIQDNIHDFAWFADKTFHVKCDTLILNTDHTVTCFAFFQPKNKKLWDQAAYYVKSAVEHYSTTVGEYPYNVCTAVDATFNSGGGMEYPTITVISSGGSAYNLHRVILHEVGHNWFYGILASNEREFPWIDEGFNSYYEERYFSKHYPNLSLAEAYFNSNKLFGFETLPVHYGNTLTYKYLKSIGQSQPISLSSEEFLPENYIIMCYQKTVTALQHLEAYLGTKDFDKIMHGFYQEYKFKHVYPDDIKTYFSAHTDNSLDWFFDELISTDELIDYGIKRMKGDSIKVENYGKISAPVIIRNGEDTLIYDGFKNSQWLKISHPDQAVIIDGDFITTDLNRTNNLYRSKKIFPKIDPLKIRMFSLIDFPHQRELGILPALGYNNTQKLLIGALFYNGVIPPKHFEYRLIPFFAPFQLQNTDFAWGGSINMQYNISTNHPEIRTINIYSSGEKYALTNYASTADQLYSWYCNRTGININIPKNSKHKQTKFNINLEHIFTYISLNGYTGFIKLGGSFSRPTILNPSSGNIQFENTPGGLKASFEGFYTVNYKSEKKGLHLRLFAGKFLYKPADAIGNYNFRLSGNSGLQDYLFSTPFIDRGADIRTHPDKFWAHQFINNEGGFNSYTPHGQTNNWLVSLNINTDLPIPLFKIYANTGVWSVVVNNAIENTAENQIKIAWETGIEVCIAKNLCSIYFPVLVSKQIKETNDIYFDNYWQKIRFTLYLNQLNIFNHRNKTYLLY